MPAAYPLVFRQKVVDAYEAGHGSFKQVGEQFGIGEATVNRWVSRTRRGEDLLPITRRPRPFTIDEVALAFLGKLLNDDPAWTTQEMADELWDAYEIKVSRQTVGRALRRVGWTRKRGVSRPPASRTARVRALREAYLDTQPKMETARLVFIDETAAWCHMPAFYGWSKAGEQAVMTGTRRGKRLSMVGAIAVDGLRGHMLYEGTMNSERMVEFIYNKLGPNLRPGDALVMDGASVHKTAAVREAVESFGAKILILPPYSPELNPIEHTWSTVKAYIRKVGAESMSELRVLANEAWERVTPFVTGWIRHCGYALST